MIITEDDREDARAMLAIWLGDFERGMAAMDAVHARLRAAKNFPALHAPVWRGESLTGKTIMVVTQSGGHGDAIQHVRFLPALKQLGAKVILCCTHNQGRLLAEADGIDQVIMASIEEPCAAWGPPEIWEHDYHVHIDSLPVALGATLETIPAAPYLSASVDAVERWRPAVAAIAGFRVGIYWQGNPAHGDDRRRSCRLAEFAPLAAVPGVSLVSLQKGAGHDQLAAAAFPVADLGDSYQAGDWLDTAGVVHHLDLVVGPDSSIAHLAGALAKPVWIALSNPSEFRWMRDRDDSPWYPTARLFRQDRLDDWTPVFERMAAVLSDQAPIQSAR